MSDTAVHDLGIDTITSLITNEPKEQQMIIRVLSKMTSDSDVALYRQEVFDDIFNLPDVRERLLELMNQIDYLKDYGTWRKNAEEKPGLWDLMHRLDELKTFITCVESLHECLSDSRIKSKGLKDLLAYIDTLYNDANFADMKKDIESIKVDANSIQSVTIGINVNSRFEAESLGLISVNAKSFKKSGIVSNFADAVASKDKLNKDTDWDGELRYEPADTPGAEGALDKINSTLTDAINYTSVIGNKSSLAKIPDGDGTSNSTFYLSNIGIYENNAGENLVGDLNPIFDDANYAALEETGDFVGFELSKDDTNADAQKAVVGHGWNGNLDYNEKRGAGMFARLVKVEDGFFNYYSDADKLIKMVKHLLASDTQYNPFADTMNPLYDPNADGQSNILDLVRVKKNIAYSAYTVTGEETNGGIYGSVSTVACYGDSITQGMGYENSLEKTYPGRLNTMLGGGYTVVNCGDPGERSFTIMARQGALSLVTSKEITFPAGTAQVQIGNNSDNGFITSKGDYIDLTARLGNERSINDVTINGNTYQVVMTDFTWSPRSCNVHLKRTDTSSTLTIPAGTAVTFNSYTRPNECDIYLCGANGVYTSANDLVAQYKAMIDKHGSNNYLVIIPFWNTYCDTPFREAFGDHCVSFREVAISTGLAYEGITPTAKDEEYISNGEVPPSLLYYPNNPDVHLNAKGYDLLAHILYEQGGAIGIW